MAIAAPHVKLLRQLARARDDYLSGAFDIAWDGGSATIFMVFGQPSHATFESGGVRLDGEAALDALLRELPPQFDVGEWRRAMSPHDTLTLSVDDIADPLAELAGEHADVRDVDEAPSWLSGHDDSPDLGFDLENFPLLPAGPPLWEPASAEDVALPERLGSLTAALVVLAGARLRAAGVVRDGDLIDAVWVDSVDHARGETAAMALLGAREGMLAGYALESGDIAEALPMLWRLPRGDSIAAAWVDAAALLASLQDDRADHALLIEGPRRAAGLFSGGAVVAAYTAAAQVPVRSTAPLLEAMRMPGTALRVLQRRGTTPAQPAAPDRHDTPPPSPPQQTDLEPSAAGGGVPHADGGRLRSRAEDAAPESPSTLPSGVRPSPPAAPGEPATSTSSWVDFDAVRHELVAIGVAWLGERDAAPVTDCVLATRSTIEDFITTIDTVRRMTVPGHDASTVHAMAREMHVHAAERLCGA